MTAHTNIAQFSAGHDALLPHMSPTPWLRDISAHSRLMVDAQIITQAQTEAMERHRLARAASDQTVSVRVEGDQLIIREGADLGEIAAELEVLDRHLAECHAQMRLLERRILTHPPQDPEEVAIMLQFVGGILRMEHRVDADYLADLLDDCADICMPTAVPQDARVH